MILAAIIFLGAQVAPEGNATVDVSVELPESATASGLEISVDDVAEVRGADAEVVARIESASLGYAPAPGYHRTLRADLVERTLEDAFPGVDIDVIGAKNCRVAPETEVVRGAELLEVAATAMRGALRGLDAEAQPEGDVKDFEVSKGKAKPKLVPRVPDSAILPGLRSVPVEVWVDDRIYRTVHLEFRISVWQRRAILKRAVAPGEALHAGLFENKRVPLTESADLGALGRDELGGAVALKTLAAGSFVTERDVHREVLLRRGDTVTVRVRKGSVQATDVGVVMADGRLGDRVRVILQSTSKELHGTVRGKSTVEVTIR